MFLDMCYCHIMHDMRDARRSLIFSCAIMETEMLRNDICRCMGQMAGYICPRRDDCARYIYRGSGPSAPWMRVPCAEYLCAGEYEDDFEFQIPLDALYEATKF